MPRMCRNIYRNARTFAKMSCEKAAMELSISESTVRKYERGTMPVPDNTALQMAKVYNAPWLRVQHLDNNTLFRELFGVVLQKENKAANILALQKEVGDVERCFPQIISATLNGAGLELNAIRECREACAALLAVIGSEKASACATNTDAPR